MTKTIIISELDVANINPTEKDFDRADGLSFHGSTFYGSGQPWVGDAKKMAKAIKDPVKLVRRAKAIVDRWGTQYTPYYSSYDGCWRHPNDDWDCWTPFKRRLYELGFNREQVAIISKYEKPVEVS